MCINYPRYMHTPSSFEIYNSIEVCDMEPLIDIFVKFTTSHDDDYGLITSKKIFVHS